MRSAVWVNQKMETLGEGLFFGLLSDTKDVLVETEDMLSGIASTQKSINLNGKDRPSRVDGWNFVSSVWCADWCEGQR